MGRTLATVAALFWGVLFFGLVDLLVVPLQDQQFYLHYLLETGWGLLFTMLVMVPLLAWAAQPRWRVFPQQVAVVAVAVLLTGLGALAPGQLLVAVFLVLSVAVSAMWERPLWPWRSLSIRGADRWLLVLVALAAIAAVIYAVQMISAAWSGRLDEETWGLMHLPMQAACGLALAGSAGTAVLAGGTGAPGWRLATLPGSVSAVWFGAVCLAYPHLLGSVGEPAGIAAIAWGVAFAGIALTQRATSRSSVG